MRARSVWKASAGGAAVAVLSACVFVAWPLPEGFFEKRSAAPVTFIDRRGGTLREVRSLVDGRSVPLENGVIPPRVRAAFIAAEDRRFEHHPGLDPLAIARAAWGNLRAGRVESGASTIHQQLARRLVPRPRTLLGKAKEALWAVRIALHVPSEDVLREYLNRVPLGNALYGVEAASAYYFARPAAHLSTAQAAMLAGMAAAPARFDPFRHPDRARRRMETVVRRMVRLGVLGEDDAQRALQIPLDLTPPASAFRTPHLVASLAARLDKLGLRDATRVYTTIDPALQADVERALREEIAALSAKQVTQGAVLVVDNRSGEVLAYAGSVDFFDESAGGQVDGVRSKRQPGSALKPFIFGLALAMGRTPATLLSDVETRFPTADGDYAPQNYDRRLHGPVRLRAALANSYNVPAVRLAEELGPARALAVLREAGFESLDQSAAHYGVGLVLGNGEVTLRELARAFVGLANGGEVASLVEVRYAEDALGARLAPAPDIERRRFLPIDATALLTDILSDESARSPAFGIGNVLRLPFPTAAKTGTSRSHIDNWTVGYTRERTVAVWVGNFNGRPMRDVSGITGAGPIFRRVMLRAMEGIAPSPLIDRSRFESARVCPLSGARATRSCPGAMSEIFVPGTVPTTPCAMHKGEGASRRVELDGEFHTWARREGLDVVPSAGDGNSDAVRLLFPRDGAEFLIEPHRPLSSQGVPVRVFAPEGIHTLILTLNGAETRLDAPFETRLPAARGLHRLEVRLPDASAPQAVATFRVR